MLPATARRRRGVREPQPHRPDEHLRVVPEHDLDIDHETLDHLRTATADRNATTRRSATGRASTLRVRGRWEGTPRGHRAVHAALPRRSCRKRAKTGFRIYVVGSRGSSGRSAPHPRVMEEFL